MKNSTLIKMAVVVCTLILAMFAAFPVTAEELDNLYPLTTIVRELDFEADAVICEDFNGNLWSFIGIEDWEIDDIASMIMYDNESPEIYDDVIMVVHYGGWAEGLI